MNSGLTFDITSATTLGSHFSSNDVGETCVACAANTTQPHAERVASRDGEQFVYCGDEFAYRVVRGGNGTLTATHKVPMASIPDDSTGEKLAGPMSVPEPSVAFMNGVMNTPGTMLESVQSLHGNSPCLNGGSGSGCILATYSGPGTVGTLTAKAIGSMSDAANTLKDDIYRYAKTGDRKVMVVHSRASIYLKNALQEVHDDLQQEYLDSLPPNPESRLILIPLAGVRHNPKWSNEEAMRRAAADKYAQDKLQNIKTITAGNAVYGWPKWSSHTHVVNLGPLGSQGDFGDQVTASLGTISGPNVHPIRESLWGHNFINNYSATAGRKVCESLRQQ